MEVDDRVSDLGDRQATGVLGTDAGAPYGAGNWVVTFDPEKFAVATGEFEIYHIALTGPTGSKFQVFIDRTFYDANNHGDLNSWDPNNTLHLIGGGSTLYFYWNTGVAPAPEVTIWLKESSALENPIS